MVDLFVAEFDVALAQHPRQLIYNIDEICWRIVNGELKALMPDGLTMSL